MCMFMSMSSCPKLLNVKCLNSFTDGRLPWIYGSRHGDIGGPIAFVK